MQPLYIQRPNKLRMLVTQLVSSAIGCEPITESVMQKEAFPLNIPQQTLRAILSVTQTVGKLQQQESSYRLIQDN